MVNKRLPSERANPPDDPVESAVRRVLQGDRDAFFTLVDAYGLSVRSYVAAQVYRMDVVDDLVQETFIAAYRNLASFRSGQPFGAWLRGIARNKLLMHYRGDARRRAAMDSFHAETLAAVADELEAAVADDTPARMEALLGCIARLPDRMRRIVRAGLDGLRAGVLAAEFNTTPGAVYNLQYRANQLLRECLLRELQRV